jgi:hypothetical protein
LPEGLHSNQTEYTLSADSLIRQHGKYASRGAKRSECAVRAFSFQLNRFSGKKLTLKGYIKTENVSDGFAGLWMRVDGNSGALSFDNMQEQNLKGTNDWKEYTISIDFDEEEAKSVYIGALLVGKGKIWLDNFHLLMDEKDISLAPVLKRMQRKADLDTAFLSGSGVQITELNKMQLITPISHAMGLFKILSSCYRKWPVQLGCRTVQNITESVSGIIKNCVQYRH